MGGWGDTIKPVESGGAGGPVIRITGGGGGGGQGGRKISTVARSVKPSVGARRTSGGWMAAISRWAGREAP